MYYGDYSKYITRLYQLVLNEGVPIPGALLDLPNDIISLFERACDIDDLFYMLRIMEISGANIGTDFGKSLPIARDGYLRAKLRLKAYYDFLSMSDELGLLFPILSSVGSESDSGELEEDDSGEVVNEDGDNGFVDLDSDDDSDDESWGGSDIDSEAVDNYFASMIKLREAKEKRSTAKDVDIFNEFIPDSSDVIEDPVSASDGGWFNDIDDVESHPEDSDEGSEDIGNWFNDLDNEPEEVSKRSNSGIRVFQRSKFDEEEDYSDGGEWVTDIDDIDYSPRKTSKATGSDDLDDEYPFEVVEDDGYREEDSGEDEEYPFEIVEDDGYREESEESEGDYPFEIVEDDGYRNEESEEDEEYPFEIVEDDGYREEGSEDGEDEDYPFEIVEDDGYRDSDEGNEEGDYPFEIVADDGYREEDDSSEEQFEKAEAKPDVPRKPIKGDKDIADAVQDSVNRAVTDVIKGIKKVIKK